jgi:ferredoxin
MRIVTVRRLFQIFYLMLLLWFCVVTTLGNDWWQLRGWPVNWLLQLDPLNALGTSLATRTLYSGLEWGLLTLCLTFFLGRFFCGWICPLGTLQQAMGYLGKRALRLGERMRLNQPHSGQGVKYWILLFITTAAAIGSNLTGWFDPLALVQRAVNLVLFPLADRPFHLLWGEIRSIPGAAPMGFLLLIILLFSLRTPRFYCRYICPSGALMALCSRWAVFRIGHSEQLCTACGRCQADCEGACDPVGQIRMHECVLCLNCRDQCRHERMLYGAWPSRHDVRKTPDLHRRQVLSAVASGLAFGPFLRVGGGLSGNWNPHIIRPPGALAEISLLARCIKCGQCMRVCPTQVIQPAVWDAGLEGLWTPTLNFRVGTSGCQHNCVACGRICPTAAIRPLTVEERMGRGPFAASGPLRIGTAFIDRGRCLPWAMDRPCIVCQENCPVSPKAIYTRTIFQAIRDGAYPVSAYHGSRLIVDNLSNLERYSGGDYFCLFQGRRRPIIAASGQELLLADSTAWPVAPQPGEMVRIAIRLQQPFIDPARCIGCGVCEHECPVQGLRAIRVTAENESRHFKHRLTLPDPLSRQP